VIRAAVDGESMLPELAPGDRLLVLPTRRVRPGDVVVLRDPRDPNRTMVKRVVAIDGSNVVVAGDNQAQSTDSRVFGPVPAQAIRGRALYRYHPVARAGWLRRRTD
jgi:nickel-type superoxide dismutase maturation protease